MSSAQSLDEVAPIEVLLRFADARSGSEVPASLAELAELLASQSGCQRCWAGRSTDEPSGWVVGSRWESVGSYRRALSNYDVKVQVGALLGMASDEPSAYEVLLEFVGDHKVQRSSDRSDPQEDRRIR